jgi:hypothetical protein
MPAVKSWGQHGTIRRYRQGGCDDLDGGEPGTGRRCDDCRMAMREYKQRDLAGLSRVRRKMNLVHGQRQPEGRPSRSNVTSITTRPQAGPCERAVSEQLAEFAAEHPVRVQMALTCARILDNPDRVNLHATTVRQLEAVLDKVISGQKKKSRGRLAVVQAMTARR